MTIPTPKTVYTSQPFQAPDGTILANGSLTLDLSGPAIAAGGGGQVVPLRVVFNLNASGLIPNGTQVLWCNDQLSPSNTYYVVRIFNSNGLLVSGPLLWIVSGVSPVDLSQIGNNSPSVYSPNAVLQNPTGAQTITGFPLTLLSSAPLNVQSALSANRLIFDEGTQLSVADFAINGWGAGAAIGSFFGTDALCQFMVTAGTSPSTRPTITLTYHDGTWNTAPLVFAQMVGGTGMITDITPSVSPTACTLTYDGSPIAAQTYVITVLSIGVVPVLFSQPPTSFANASTIVAQTSLTGQTSSLSSTLYAVGSMGAGVYRITSSVIVTATGTGNVNASFIYNNGSASQTDLGKTVGFGVLGSEAGDVFEFYSAASQAISYTTSYTATGTYSLRIRLEYLG